jgi:hypothetical protein
MAIAKLGVFVDKGEFMFTTWTYGKDSSLSPLG